MSSNSSGSKGGEWTALVHFCKDKVWEPIPTDELIYYFQHELKAKKEIIIHSEIRKYDLLGIPGWFGNWHEYTLVKTSNWYWSFEKMSDGIHVQRSKNKDAVRCKYAGGDRPGKDRSEGRSSSVSNGENVLDIVHWILNRGELDKTYHVFNENCHFFASLLYEAITRTVKGRRLSTTF